MIRRANCWCSVGVEPMAICTWRPTWPAAKAISIRRPSALSDPLPKDLGGILKRFKKVLIPELNLGQLRMLIRSEFLIDAIGLNKVAGQPFLVRELSAKIDELVGKK